MLRAFFHGLLILSLMLCASAIEVGYPRCNCDVDGFWSVEGILQCQKVSDFLIAAAYFSIPLELLYFATCSDLFPFKWIVFQFGAFIVLCGLTHLLNVFTYEPHSFLLMLSLTISKLFTALVSFATAVTLLTLIPQLLRVKVRENFLRLKARELDREVGMMKRQEEARWHVRMLTHEIRKSLDRHTILYTTLIELSKTLGLQNCAVWMPDEGKKVMNLTHELRQRSSIDLYGNSIPIDDRDVIEVKATKGVKILKTDSMLAVASCGGDHDLGSTVAIRMPMLKVSNFKGGTPELVQASYAVLVLVLPREDSRVWSCHELEIIEVIADQVAVALSHAAVLEESQFMRDKLAEQNRALLREKQNALMASEARNSFQRVMSQVMRRPIHSILGLLSMMQQEKLSCEQRLIIDTITKTGGVVSTLITDAMEISNINSERLTLEMRSFHLHSMIKEAASVARCLCACRGFGFGFQVDNAVPDRVIGDEKRIFHVLLHVVDKLLSGFNEGFVTFQVHSFIEPQDGHDQAWIPWKSNFPGVSFKFEIGIKTPECSDSSSSSPRACRLNTEGYDMGLSFNMCRNLVQMMHGDIWVVPNSQGLPKSIKLALQFQLQSLTPVSECGGTSSKPPSIRNFKGLRVILVDDDDVNRAVTRKLLEKLGCKVASVSSGIHCLRSLIASSTPYQLVILDLHMPQMDGFEVAVRIRKLRSRCWPAIVALTASSEEHIWQRCLQVGMSGLIRKPVMLQDIGDELYRVLHNT
ncbi:Protein EIN4 [Apostasia shenzhenica]|uniref:Ethylene receptor n=1 Tax=Apostasia shenzhenica TaxID=1088818 RepID=A0A2H9ZWV0_9ASPA|nr:Protein EIN4 [Apostasia shenzhenica]